MGRRTLGALTAAAILVLSACGGGSGDSGATASSPSASNPAASNPSATASLSAPASSSSSGPAAAASGWGYPEATETQALRIGEAAGAAVEAAVRAGDVAAARSRLAGPARELLAARLTIAAAGGSAASVVTSLTPSRLLIPQAGPWPRWFLIAGPAEGHATPVVRLLVSPDARAPYAVWADLDLVPGATLPPVADDGEGGQLPAPDTTDLAMSPTEVAGRYADVLNRGRASAFRAAFAEDPFRTQVTDRLAADRKQLVSGAVASLSSTHTPVEDAGYAVRTQDGGALVVIELRQTYQVTVVAGGGVVRPDADLAALAGRDSFAKSLRRSSVEVLAFTVPPRGSKKPVRLVAAAKGDVAASGS